jgi:DNA-directed RNA polymerase alpha subunit
MTPRAIALHAEISRLKRELALLRGESDPPVSSGSTASADTPTDSRSLQVAEVFAARTILNTRIRNTCASMKLKTLGELCRHSPEELLARRCFGIKCLRRTEAVLAEHGLRLCSSSFNGPP